ncbi:phosphotransferase family protein [Tenggerimyces flavus]|uniref:Phosphotransferase family protein n=1 Tax=Tenggerimyces flavus TaxID=1708749 RepID=A0ABV7YHD1_9ACTN|nr:phosphotransferase [Tenggerimyces flavus]MBM7784578.1 aminoglycoside phosphotransferase (APT) family kinase protein [Tenggerimyces flavus]
MDIEWAEDLGTFNSRTARVWAAGEPRSSFLKQPTSELWSIEAARGEAGFYRLVASLPDHPPVVPRAIEIGDGAEPFLVLEDLSATHRAPLSRDDTLAGEGVPSEADQLAVVDTLARLKAFWWDHPLQGSLLPAYWSAESEGFLPYAKRRRASWMKVRNDLPSKANETYEHLLDGLPTYWERWLGPRVADGRGLTLLHGDAYFSNFLVPRTTGHAYLIDWQSCCVDVGAGDLVNLMATFWTREQRRGRERELLREFHRRLVGYGVAGYAFDDLLLDYRFGLVYWALMPVQDAHDGAARSYWLPKLTCLLDAFDEWDCADLLI